MAWAVAGSGEQQVGAHPQSRTGVFSVSEVFMQGMSFNFRRRSLRKTDAGKCGNFFADGWSENPTDEFTDFNDGNAESLVCENRRILEYLSALQTDRRPDF